MVDDQELAAGLRAMHVEDGGTWLTDQHRVLRLKPAKPIELPIEMLDDEPVTSTDEAIEWVEDVVAAFCIAVILVGIVGYIVTR